MTTRRSALLTAVTASLLFTQIAPTLSVYAQSTPPITSETVDWESQYPKLINPNPAEIQHIEFSEATRTLLDAIFADLTTLESTYTEELLFQTMDKFNEAYIQLTQDETALWANTDRMSQFDYIYKKLIYIGFTQNTAERDRVIVELADKLYLGAVKRFNTGVNTGVLLSIGDYLKFELADCFESSRTAQILGFTNDLLYLLSTSMTNGSIDPLPETELPSTIQPEVAPPSLPEPELPVIPSPEAPTVTPPAETLPDGSVPNGIEYYLKGSSCFKKVTYYNLNGVATKEDHILVSGEDAAYCHLSFPDVPDVSSWNNQYKADLAFDIWGTLNQNEINKTSDQTLQFTITKDTENPYYFDTGIRTTVDKTVTYTQLRAVFNLIPLKVKGTLLEDEGKLLFIAEGKPLVLADKKEAYTQAEVEQLLTNFTSIGLKIDTMKSVSEAVPETESSIKTILNGEKITLKLAPVFENGAVLLPIREISELLGLQVQVNDESISITNDSDSVTFKKDSNIIMVNGAEKTLSTKASIKKSALYGEMGLALQTLGCELSYSTDTYTLTIQKLN